MFWVARCRRLGIAAIEASVADIELNATVTYSALGIVTCHQLNYDLDIIIIRESTLYLGNELH